MFDTLAGVNADLYVSLGDWPYADNPPAAQTAGEFREAHVKARSAAKLQAWLHGTSVRGILDDHEIRNDWDAASAEREPERHAAALALWDEWFPRRGGGPRYRRWRWGAHLECFLLDCRSYRAPSMAPDGAGKSMLGAAQRDWLVAGDTASAARFKLIFTSVPLDFGHGVDHWAGYTVERDGILDALADAGTPGVIFLSADQHWFAAQRHRHGAREFQTGPLARAPLPLPPPHPDVMMRSGEYNAGVIDADADGLRVQVLGASGGVLWDERFTPEQLTLRRA
jgi:alkaline phosphatase D